MRRQDLNLMNVIREIVNQPRDLGSHNRSDGGEHKGNQADENEINEQDRQCPGDFFLKQAHDRIKNEKQNARDQNRKKQSGDKTEKRLKNKRDFR